MRIAAFGGEALDRVCLVVCSRPNDEDRERLKRIMDEIHPVGAPEVYQKFKFSVADSGHPAEGHDFAVLVEIDSRKLLDLLVLEDPLWDVPSVLLVPRLSTSGAELAGRLLPRLLAEKADDQNSLTRIIKKLKEADH